MNNFKFFLTGLIVLSSTFSFSQQFETTKISNNSVCNTSIVWVNHDTICLVSEKSNKNWNHFKHNLTLYNLHGNRLNQKKIETAHSFYHQYTLKLNNSIVFFYDRKDEYGIHSLNNSIILTDGLIKKKGIGSIFKVKAIQEGRNIDKEQYSFQAIKSASGNNALLTYTNDYKSGLSEKIRFKIMDKDYGLTHEDTIILPYEHKTCNITETIYDDIDSCIYIIGNLFLINKKKDKEFTHSFIGKYKINTKEYISAIGPIPALNDLKLQWRVTKSELILSGLHINSYDTTGWSTLNLVINKQSMQVRNQITRELSASTTKKFRLNNKNVNVDYIAPWNIIIDKNGAYHSLWVYYGGSDNATQKKNEQFDILLYTSLLAGLPVTLLVLPIAIAKTKGLNEVTALLWVVDSANSHIENCVISLLDKYSGCYSDFSTLSLKNKIYCIYNNSPDPKHKSFTTTFKYYENSNLINDTTLKDSLPLNIFIFPWSEYSSGDYKYYIGHRLSDPPHNNPHKNKKGESYVIRIKTD